MELRFAVAQALRQVLGLLLGPHFVGDIQRQDDDGVDVLRRVSQRAVDEGVERLVKSAATVSVESNRHLAADERLARRS